LQQDADLMSKLNIEELEKSNKAKDTVLLKIRAVDQARHLLVKQIAAKHQLPVEQVKLTDLCKYSSPNQSERLLKLRTRLFDIIGELRLIQEQTYCLATTSLKWINGSMSSLKGLFTPASTYSSQGQFKSHS